MVGWTEILFEDSVALRSRPVDVDAAEVSDSAGGGWWMLPFVLGGSCVGADVVCGLGGEVVDEAVGCRGGGGLDGTFRLSL